MRLSDDEVRHRFEAFAANQRALMSHPPGAPNALFVPDVWLFVSELARDLQAPPTGEEVAKAREDLIEAIGELAAEGYSLGMAEGSYLPDHLEIKSLAASRDESREECVSAIDKFGSACAAAARAESGKREPTDATESEAFCALKNRLTDLLNSHGHYREMTAYQGALERYREAVASEARRRSRKAADVLKRLETALANDTTLPTVHLEELGTYFHCKIVECAGARRTVEVAEKTLEGAIAAAIDQLAAETGRR